MLQPFIMNYVWYLSRLGIWQGESEAAYRRVLVLLTMRHHCQVLDIDCGEIFTALWQHMFQLNSALEGGPSLLQVVILTGEAHGEENPLIYERNHFLFYLCYSSVEEKQAFLQKAQQIGWMIMVHSIWSQPKDEYVLGEIT